MGRPERSQRALPTSPEEAEGTYSCTEGIPLLLSVPALRCLCLGEYQLWGQPGRALGAAVEAPAREEWAGVRDDGVAPGGRAIHLVPWLPALPPDNQPLSLSTPAPGLREEASSLGA